MNKHQNRYTTLNVQASSFVPQSFTTGYKAHEESIDLPLRRKKSTTDDQHEQTLSSANIDRALHGSTARPRKITKSFKLTKRAFGLNTTITETTRTSETPVYLAISSELNPKQPDIVFYAGESKHGDCLAVAFFRFSRHIRMGFGTETLTKGDGVWEEMKNNSKWPNHDKYEFEYDTPNSWLEFVDSQETERRRKKFSWVRTRDERDGVKGYLGTHFGWRNYRLIEEESERVLAVMLVSMYTGFKYKGEIILHEILAKEMEVVALLTATCIFEKGERRIRHSAGGYASGGGP